VEIRVVYSQENLTGNHNSILPTIYISVLGLCYNFSMPTLMSMPCPHICYELKLKGLSNKTTLVLSNTRELDRELFYKLVYLI